MRGRLKLLAAPPIAALLMLIGVTTALAATSVTVYPFGVLVSPIQAYLGAQITCSADTLRPNLAIQLSQPSGSGTGNAGTIACDKQPHFYAVPLTATSGTFQAGRATATVNWSYRTCSPSTNGPPKCVGNASSTNKTVTLYQVPLPDQD